MALLISSASFSAKEVPLALTHVYVDVMAILPHYQQPAEVRLLARSWSEEYGAGKETVQVDGLQTFRIPLSELIKHPEQPYKPQLNADNFELWILSKLEENNPQWLGKITQI